MSGLDIKKTYKLFINGAFPRSESGRVYEVKNSKGEFIANPCLASRKDLRDSVLSSRAAFSGWAKSTAYLRGQILYRIAEMTQGRAAQLVDELIATGLTKAKATAEVAAAIDQWVWFAGWADKLAALRGGTNPVAGPYYNFTIPEAQGVVAIFSPNSFQGFVNAVAPVIVSGNTATAIVSGPLAIPVMTFAEIIATSDLPAGVLNILTGSLTELGPWAAAHMDIDAMDITGISKKNRSELKIAGAENLKRIHAFDGATTPERIFSFMEAKTVWHPIGV